MFNTQGTITTQTNWSFYVSWPFYWRQFIQLRHCTLFTKYWVLITYIFISGIPWAHVAFFHVIKKVSISIWTLPLAIITHTYIHTHKFITDFLLQRTKSNHTGFILTRKSKRECWWIVVWQSLCQQPSNTWKKMKYYNPRTGEVPTVWPNTWMPLFESQINLRKVLQKTEISTYLFTTE